MVVRYTTAVVVLAALLMVGARAVFALDIVWAWLIAINVVALCTYGYDKAMAGALGARVPEVTLLLLVLVGGSLGALVGMQVFRHKTAKRDFQRRFWLVALLQVVLMVGALVVISRMYGG